MKKLSFLFIFLLLVQQCFSQQITIKLNEGFETTTFPPSGWKRINPMGANQWERKTAPLPPEIMQPPIQGTAVARIDYENTGGDDWLITKKIYSVSEGDSLLFYFIKQSDSGPFPPDSLLIAVSTTDSLIGSFTNSLLKIDVAGLPTGNQIWRRYCLPLTQFAGQNIFIAFHHKDNNGHGCAIDSVVVFNPGSIGISKINTKIPEKPILYQNYPNPFNPSTNIRFQIVKNGQVKLRIYDLLGNNIITLFDKYLTAGIYNVSLSLNKIPKISSGVYYYRLEADYYISVKSMILIK